ncbi:hypothetical protein HYS03_00420 [Candidatus Woesebacteria bacterium]|nr:hypothetical protein [Candidatus Woesebacteria bacterium]QQG47647.1 MAG: hypothetical protein HY044_00995 [Candidatus Woesebacteria bacterium]
MSDLSNDQIAQMVEQNLARSDHQLLAIIATYQLIQVRQLSELQELLGKFIQKTGQDIQDISTNTARSRVDLDSLYKKEFNTTKVPWSED